MQIISKKIEEIKEYENNPSKYYQYFNNNFENTTKGMDFDIMRIQRYIKVFGFYKLKTIYRRY